MASSLILPTSCCALLNMPSTVRSFRSRACAHTTTTTTTDDDDDDHDDDDDDDDDDGDARAFINVDGDTTGPATDRHRRRRARRHINAQSIQKKERRSDGGTQGSKQHTSTQPAARHTVTPRPTRNKHGRHESKHRRNPTQRAGAVVK